jgi:hypothetical protein
MTAQEIINRAREILKDDIEPYRLPDAYFFPPISDVLYEIEARRPDMLIQANGTFATVTDISAVGDTINFPDRTREAMACYVSYRSYISEDADRHNSSQAAALLGRYESLIQTI